MDCLSKWAKITFEFIVAILPLMAFYPWWLFCCQAFVIGQFKYGNVLKM